MKQLAALLLLTCGLLQAQAPKRPMTFEDLMAMKRVSDPQISPSGKWVLFSVTDVSLAQNTRTNHLWVVPIGGGKETQVTTGAGESNGRFSPDGTLVMFSAGDQLRVAPFAEATGTLDFGKTFTITALETGADGGIWAPDSRHFLFTSSVFPECESNAPMGPRRNHEENSCNTLMQRALDKNPVQAQLFTHLLYRHWNQYVGPKHSHIFYAELPHAAIIDAPEDLTPASVIGDHEAPTFSLGGPLGYAIAPDGKEIAYVTNLDKEPAASTNNDIFTLKLDAEPKTAQKISTSLGSDDGPQYSPDGKWLAFRSQERAGYESDRFRLMVMDRAAKTTRDLMPNFDGWVDEFSWTGKSEGIFYTTAFRGEENVDFIGLPNAGPGNKMGWLEGEGEFSDIRIAPDAGVDDDGTILVATRMTATSPSEIVRLPKQHRAGTSEWGGEVAITHQNDALLNTLSLMPLKSFTFVGAEGAKVQGFLVKPPNFDPSKKYPVKFLIHGGPQGAWGDAWSYRWNPELMAASGYVVVMVNPRGSTGYGQAFIDGVNGDWGGKPYIDLMRGLDAAEAQFPFLDKTRECALGASYGGFMANWILTHTNRFKCIVSHDGMYNPAAAYGDTEELWFNEWEFRQPGAKEPGQPWRYASLPADQDPFRKWSPMLHIQDAKTPTLVIHSQRDYRLDVSEGFQLFTALQRLNVPSEMLYFPDEGHWVTKPQNAQLWNKTVSDWCDKWTKP